MQEMERLAAKGEIPEEELRALEEDVTGKIMLASWRGTRFEVVQVLREVSLTIFLNSKINAHVNILPQVVDKVLKEPGISELTLYNRAKGLLLIGTTFKATQPDESDIERRELERSVHIFIFFTVIDILMIFVFS